MWCYSPCTPYMAAPPIVAWPNTVGKRWFQAWSLKCFLPLVRGVMNNLLKGHVFTIPNRSPAELPGFLMCFWVLRWLVLRNEPSRPVGLRMFKTTVHRPSEIGYSFWIVTIFFGGAPKNYVVFLRVFHKSIPGTDRWRLSLDFRVTPGPTAEVAPSVPNAKQGRLGPEVFFSEGAMDKNTGDF